MACENPDPPVGEGSFPATTEQTAPDATPAIVDVKVFPEAHVAPPPPRPTRPAVDPVARKLALLKAIIANHADAPQVLVSGRIDSMVVKERDLPLEALRWMPTPTATLVSLTDTRLLCPASHAATFANAFWLHGGIPPNSESGLGQPDVELTEGAVYAFFLRQVGGEWFLVVPDEWVFATLENGDYQDKRGTQLSEAQLEEVCP